MTTLADNPLRDIADGGVGYCYGYDRSLFPGAGELVDGPLLIGLDSNVIFDLENYGAALVNDDELVGADPKHVPDLEAIGSLVEAWFLRDIRFVLLPSTWTDFRKEPSSERMRARSKMFVAIEDALSFQLQDWSRAHDRFTWERPADQAASATIDQVIDPLDRAMIDSAWRAGVDIFITSDEKFRKHLQDLPPCFPNVWSPREFNTRLPAPGSTSVSGGTINHSGCLWRGEVIMGDLGRMSRLLEVLS